jgi:hypothetical protein
MVKRAKPKSKRIRELSQTEIVTSRVERGLPLEPLSIVTPRIFAAWTPPIVPGLMFAPTGILPAVSLEEILRELQRYLNDPSQLITGPKSTGKRDETTKSWKEHCEGDGRTLATHCPLKSAEWKCNFWDRIGATSGNLQGTLTVSWQYDCCNVYNASAKYTVDINDSPKDVGVFVKEDYSMPEVDPVDLAPCKPCTPKCLRVQLAIVLYAIPLGGIPGQRRQMSLDLRICPGIGGPAFTDKTAYGENRGNDDGSVANPKKGETVPDPATNANNTWGVRPLAGYPQQT